MKVKCEIFKLGVNLYGKKRFKRCRSTAVKIIEGKNVCINCYNQKIQQP